MIKPTLIAAALLLGSAAMAPAMAQVDVSIVVGSAPPPLRLETMPPPRAGYIWAPGYWNWDGYRHVWLPGRWEPERHGMYFQQPLWIHSGSGWRLDRGGWVTTRIGGRTYVELPPPPPRYEPAPPPRPGWDWTPGYWDYRNNTHVWVGGNWRPHHGGGHWNEHGHGHGRGRDGWRDSDHDGIPNRYDRDRDNDGIPNRHDRDRDGDGVPNRYDRRPDNPHRR